jgi:hypothetical protein
LSQRATEALDTAVLRGSATEALDTAVLRGSETEALDPAVLRGSETEALDPAVLRGSEEGDLTANVSLRPGTAVSISPDWRGPAGMPAPTWPSPLLAMRHGRGLPDHGSLLARTRTRARPRPRPPSPGWLAHRIFHARVREPLRCERAHPIPDACPSASFRSALPHPCHKPITQPESRSRNSVGAHPRSTDLASNPIALRAILFSDVGRTVR